MTLTTHAATGMFVTQWTNSPLLGFLVAVGSHYLTDAIPHGDEFIYWRHVHNSKDVLPFLTASMDLFSLTLLLLAVFNFRQQDDTLVLVAATIGGILPDIFMTLYTKHKKRMDPDYAEVKNPLRKAYRLFLLGHWKFHAFFHDIMRTPIRFRTALLYQSLFLVYFLSVFI